jgi:formylmethanofuran dehydrogenase subunit A
VANPDDIEKAFSRCAAFFKRGVEVVRNGDIVSNGNKRTLGVNVKVKDNPQVTRDIKEKFIKYYSMTQNNYEALGHHFIPNPYALEVDAT